MQFNNANNLFSNEIAVRATEDNNFYRCKYIDMIDPYSVIECITIENVGIQVDQLILVNYCIYL